MNKVEFLIKSKKLFFLSLVLLLCFLPVHFFFIGNNRIVENHNYEITNLKTSESWIISPILIDGDATGVGAHNWTWAASQDWCKGNGSSSDPYIIENITINGMYLYDCLTIQDSNAYFIINNCTCMNSGTTESGIFLKRTNYGKLINNTLKNCYYGNIRLLLTTSSFSILILPACG